jgi:hypothetical protein
MPDFVEKRKVSTEVSTADVLPGKLLNVPSALPSGKIPDAPIVAVNTIPWYKSVTLYVCAAFPFLDILAEQLSTLLNFKPGTHRYVVFAVAVYLGWRRLVKNTVVRY